MSEPYHFTVTLMDAFWWTCLCIVLGYAIAKRDRILDRLTDWYLRWIDPDPEPFIDQPYDWADHE